MSLRRPALLSTLTRFSNPRRRNPPYQGKHAQRDQVADAIFAKLLSNGVEEKEARRRSFAIATAQLQKHGYLKPGTATPTPKGAAKIGALMRKVRRKNPDLSNADAVKKAKALVKKAEKLTQEDTSVVEFEQGIAKIVNSIYDLCTKSHYEFNADEADSYIEAVRALLSVGAEVRRLRRAGKLKEAQAELQRVQAPFAWMAKKNPGSGSGRVEHLGHTITITNGRYCVEPYGVCFTGSDGFVQAKAWIADHIKREKSRAKRKNPMASRRKTNPGRFVLTHDNFGTIGTFASLAAAKSRSEDYKGRPHPWKKQTHCDESGRDTKYLWFGGPGNAFTITQDLTKANPRRRRTVRRRRNPSSIDGLPLYTKGQLSTLNTHRLQHYEKWVASAEKRLAADAEKGDAEAAENLKELLRYKKDVLQPELAAFEGLPYAELMQAWTARDKSAASAKRKAARAAKKAEAALVDSTYFGETLRVYPGEKYYIDNKPPQFTVRRTAANDPNYESYIAERVAEGAKDERNHQGAWAELQAGDKVLFVSLGRGLKKNPRRRKNPTRRRNPAEGKFAIQDFRDLWFTGNSTDLKRTFTGSVGSTVKGYQTREGAQRALARLKGKLLSKGPKWGDVAESLRVVPYPAWF